MININSLYSIYHTKSYVHKMLQLKMYKAEKPHITEEAMPRE